MMTLTDGAEVFVGFINNDNAVVYRATVLVAEHRIVRRSWGAHAIAEWESVHATEAEALAACAAQLRERAMALAARADDVASRARTLDAGVAR